MFTGIVEEVGEVLEIEDRGKFRTIRIQGNAVFDDLRTGSSIAVNGVCLTAVDLDGVGRQGDSSQSRRRLPPRLWPRRYGIGARLRIGFVLVAGRKPC